ncbi:asparagine synthase (glutamine-hydrolyzing) [Pelagibius sp.]|uniref:asparagine synthase (glutamine-hydrolyzing) n=1 Tax=Pelagibius sp. TaxID=1931238 RepID=UPI003BAE1F7B
MCGLAGYINVGGAPVKQGVLQAMASAIAHRGPDGEGIWREGNVGLTHRRLAVIDLSDAASQPMHSADDRYVLVFNGMIYNFRELRGELQALGYVFHSRTDSEVLLNSVIHWGPHALSRFNGMFAFALWDRQTRQLLLARDRYGIKPLYYCRQGRLLAFASEQKAMLAIPNLARRLDKKALLEYFTFQNLFTDSTFLEGVSVLPPGHYASVDVSSSDPELELVRYWDFHFREPVREASRAEYREELDRLFRQAVNRQLVSDVALGSYLSGGIDSSSITAVAAHNRPNIDTFTCGFDLASASGMEIAFDEREAARCIADFLHTTHHETVLNSGDMERALPTLAHHLEEPRVGQSYPNFYAAQLASRHVKVVLSGAGGDEMFGGYPWRYYRAAVSDDFEHYIDQYYGFWHRLIPNVEVAKLFAPIWPDVNDVWTRDIFRDVFDFHENKLETAEDYINHSLYFEAKTFLHGLLVVEDKISMAHGLESRVPFLDNDLVDFAMKCPVSLKLNNLRGVIRTNENEMLGRKGKYFQKSADGKQILRDVMERYVPRSTAKAVKQGFSAPDASWFKGESIDFVRRSILSDNARIHEYLDRATTTRLVEEHTKGATNRRLFIWSLLSFEAFLAEYLP